MSYDVYVKKRWDKARYKMSSIRNNMSDVANDTVSICNTLSRISSEIMNLSNDIESYSFNRIATSLSDQVDDMRKSFGNVSNSCVNDLQKVVSHINSTNKYLGREMSSTASRMKNINTMLDNIRG